MLVLVHLPRFLPSPCCCLHSWLLALAGGGWLHPGVGIGSCKAAAGSDQLGHLLQTFSPKSQLGSQRGACWLHKFAFLVFFNAPYSFLTSIASSPVGTCDSCSISAGRGKAQCECSVLWVLLSLCTTPSVPKDAKESSLQSAPVHTDGFPQADIYIALGFTAAWCILST